MDDWLLSILMLAGAALLVGGVYILRKGTNRKQGLLMLIAAAVMFANVGIWLIPAPQANAPVESSNSD
ncbi:hypothetical protein [Parasphingorhabdus sp.]|jgi:hypothetical protein|uniref:hypothetical protein n=1 Tax=Parasphingorhabdus sp. TaxID=2709688 RepID=UPI0007F52892|nr:hypothetical protein A8B75_02080 [Sphingomonadales bacterium EhC05]